MARAGFQSLQSNSPLIKVTFDPKPRITTRSKGRVRGKARGLRDGYRGLRSVTTPPFTQCTFAQFGELLAGDFSGLPLGNLQITPDGNRKHSGLPSGIGSAR